MNPPSTSQQQQAELLRRAMVKKYLRSHDIAAYHLWVYAVALENLYQNPNAEKADFLLHEAYDYLKSYNFTFHADKDTKEDLQKIIDELTVLAINC